MSNILGNIQITEANAPTIQHALEVALHRGSYTSREADQIQAVVDDLLLFRLKPAVSNKTIEEQATDWAIDQTDAMSEEIVHALFAVVPEWMHLVQDYLTQQKLVEIISAQNDARRDAQQESQS